MMECDISVSAGMPKRFGRWTREILALFGPDITYSAGRRYSLRNPVSRIFLLSEEEYDESLSKDRSGIGRLSSGYTPRFESYGGLGDFRTSDDLKRFYEKESVAPIDTSLGYWTPVPVYDRSGVISNDRFESHIFVCPKRTQKYAMELKSRLSEVSPQSLQKCVFKTALIHEIGHHYTLANFSAADVQLVMTHQDLNILEGLANWFAYMFLTREERFVQAEMAVDQDVWYRYYLYFKHADLSVLLDCFLAESNYLKAPAALKTVIGGQLNHNGFMMFVKGRYDGVAMDWSGKGGAIVAGDSMKALATMNSGCFISPKIELLIGRFSRDVLIVSNEIVDLVDYGRIPSNIMILPREEIDLRAVISDHLEEESNVALRHILQDLGFGSDEVHRLTQIPYMQGG